MAEDYVVQQGESVCSIAAARGFDWHTLWNDGGNSALKQKRSDPDTLLPGDVLHIPDLRINVVDKASDATHPFKLKTKPCKFRLVLLKDPDPAKDKLERTEAGDFWQYIEKPYPGVKCDPFKDAPYKLMADGKVLKQDTTGADGLIETDIAATAQDGVLILFPGKENERSIELNFRCMDPIETVQGVCKRLNNLGNSCPVEDSVTGPVSWAIKQFQINQTLSPTDGQLTDAVRDKIKTTHGG